MARIYANMLIERGIPCGEEIVTTMSTVTVEGFYRRAQPDVGIMCDYVEFVCATDRDGGDVELEPFEIEAAELKLMEAV